MTRLITGHEPEMAAHKDDAIVPAHRIKLRILRDNSPAELAHPYLPLGWQEDGSLIMEAMIYADNADLSQIKSALLETVFKFKLHPSLEGFELGEPGFTYEFTGSEIGPGKIICLGVR